MTLYEQRVKRLHDHVIANQKKLNKVNEPTAAELRAMLDEKGIEYDKRATKPELIELLKKVEEQNNDDEGAE